MRLSVLVFGVLLVHSLPEGLAIGTAYASDLAGLSLFVILAIGLQNVPEGTSVAIPMAEAGFSRSSQFWAAVLTSAPQPVGAVLAYLVVEHVQALLPASFAFAAGAMLALVAFELVPQAFGREPMGACECRERCWSARYARACSNRRHLGRAFPREALRDFRISSTVCHRWRRKAARRK